MLTNPELHYLKQAAGAPDGQITEHGAFGIVPLRHLVELGYLAFEGAGGSVYRRTYRITDAGRAALEAGPLTDVPQVEQTAAPTSEHTAKKVRELNARLEKANAVRLTRNLDAPLVGYKFRWDAAYDGVKLESPRPGTPVWAGRGLINCEAAIDDYQRAGIEAMKTLQAPPSQRGRATVTPDAQAPLSPASAADPRRPAQIRVTTPDQDGAKPGHLADLPAPKRHFQEVTDKPAPCDSSAPEVPASSVTDNAAPAQAAVGDRRSALASNAAPEQPDAGPEYGRWMMETQLKLSASLIKFGHSIGADKARPGVLVVGITQRKHDLAAWEALQAALPPDAALTHVKTGVFHVTRRNAPAAPPSASAAVAGESPDKRGQRPVTLTSAPRSSAIDEYKRDTGAGTLNQLTRAARHPRTTARALTHLATCAQCGKPFQATRNDAKTCSATCRKAYSRRGAELRKAYEEAQRALAEIGARLRKHPDLVDQAADNLETLAREAARLLAECHAGSAAD